LEKKFNTEDLIGMGYGKAIVIVMSAGLLVRMVSVDDESFPLTMDVRSDRVNLSIKDSIVIDTYIG